MTRVGDPGGPKSHLVPNDATKLDAKKSDEVKSTDVVVDAKKPDKDAFEAKKEAPVLSSVSSSTSRSAKPASAANIELMNKMALGGLMTGFVNSASAEKTAAASAPAKTPPAADTKALLKEFEGVKPAQRDALIKRAATLAKQDPGVASGLAKLLDSDKSDESTRIAAAKALGEIKDPSTVPALLGASRGYNPVNHAARDAMAQFPEAVEDLALRNFKDLNPKSQRAALERFANSTDSRAVEVFANATRSRDADVRETAMENIKKAFDRGNPALAQSPELRQKALGVIKDLVHDSKMEVRREAVSAMYQAGQTYPEEAAQTYIDALGKSGHPEHKSDLIGFGTPKSIEDAINKDPKLKEQAIDVLTKLAGKPDRRDTVRFGQERAFFQLGKIKDPAVSDFVLKQLSSRDKETRKSALSAVTNNTDPRVIAKTASLIADKDLKYDAANKLDNLGSRYHTTETERLEGLDAMRKTLETFPKDSDEYRLLSQQVNKASRFLDVDPKSLDQTLADVKAGRLSDAGKAMATMDRGSLMMLRNELGKSGSSLPKLVGQIAAQEPTQANAIQKRLLEHLAIGERYANVSHAPELRADLQQILKDSGDQKTAAFAKEIFEHAERHGDSGFLVKGSDLGKSMVDVLKDLDSDGAVKGITHAFNLKDPKISQQVRDRLGKVPAEQAERSLLGMIDAPGVPLAQRRGIAGGLNQIEGSPKIQGRLQAMAETELKALSKGLKADVDKAQGDMNKWGSRLGKLYQLRSLVYKDSDLLPPAEKQRMYREIGTLETNMRSTQERIEGQASGISAYLSDPDIAAIFSKMPAEHRDELLGGAMAGMGQTKAGRDFFSKEINPTLQGHGGKPLWEEVYSGTNKVRGLGLKLVDEFAPALALQGERAYTKAMSKALGLNSSQLNRLEGALISYQMGNQNAASRTLKEMGLDKLGTSGIKTLSGAFSTMNFALSMRDLIKEPSWKNALVSAKSTAELGATLGTLAKEGSRLSKFGKLLGKAAPPLDIVLGAMGIADAAERGDVAGTIFNSMTAAGGVVATAGLALDSTVVGAVAGVPLTVIGGIIAGVGTVGNWIFGDSDAEIYAKELGFRP